MEAILSEVQEMKDNVNNLQREWQEVISMTAVTLTPQQVVTGHDVIVSEAGLQQVAMETNQLKAVLPDFFHKANLSHLSRKNALEKELADVKKERDLFSSEAAHWKTQLDEAVSETQKNKQEQLEMRMDMEELRSQLFNQSEFCLSLGTSCCTLLWGVSRQDDTIQNLISGNKSDAFLELVSNSIHSYLTAYKDDQWPASDSQEASFMMALCGTVTNIAASAIGREFLTTNANGRKVVDTFILFITEAPLEKSSFLKNLMLMSLYNVSINQKGLKYLCSKEGLMAMLVWHLKGEKNCAAMAGTLRLIHSLILDASSVRLLHELKEHLPVSYLQELTTHDSKEVQDLALDLAMDLRQMTNTNTMSLSLE